MALQSGLKEVLCDNGLEVRIYYLECLAQATYIISHNGVAFIVDPRRDVDIYIKVLLYIGVMEKHVYSTLAKKEKSKTSPQQTKQYTQDI